MHTCVHAHMHTHAQNMHIQACILAHTYTGNTGTHTGMHRHTQAHTSTNIHTGIQIHIHLCVLKKIKHLKSVF